ncbi:hypothetical protein AVEN_13968-1 [Araneus ventricosus]|uniref:Uncharacterized protein n=1 Tax=Araneus ventricosus TaxID=182803 RepID=A0A4Y2K2F5_ARAVE|nr:hypothetical protein AVEN_13968-1 [Araneus ventricosus]
MHIGLLPSDRFDLKLDIQITVTGHHGLVVRSRLLGLKVQVRNPNPLKIRPVCDPAARQIKRPSGVMVRKLGEGDASSDVVLSSDRDSKLRGPSQNNPSVS